MKKIFALVLVLTLLCSCSASRAFSFILQPMNCRVIASGNGITLDATVRYVSPSDISLTISEPNELSKTTFYYKGETYGCVRDKREIKIPSSSKLTGQSNMIESFFCAMSQIGKSEHKVSLDSEKIDLTYAYGSFTAEADTQSKRLSAIKTQLFEYKFIYQE